MFCRPLIKLVDRLLLVGMLRDEDVEKLLIMIHPETWDSTFEKGINFQSEIIIILSVINCLYRRKR